MQRVRAAEMAEYRKKVAEDEARKEAEIAETIRLREEALARERAAEAERLRIKEMAHLAAAVVEDRIKAIYTFFMELFLRKEFSPNQVSRMPLEVVKEDLLRQYGQCHENKGFSEEDPMKLAIFHFHRGLELIVSKTYLEKYHYDNMPLVQNELHYACYNAQKAFDLASSFPEKRFVTCLRLLGGMFIHGFFYSYNNNFHVARHDQLIREHVLLSFREFVTCSFVETAIKGSYPVLSISRNIKMAGDHQERFALVLEVVRLSSTLVAHLCPALRGGLCYDFELEQSLHIPHPEVASADLGSAVVTTSGQSNGKDKKQGSQTLVVAERNGSVLSGIRPTIYRQLGKHLDAVTALLMHDQRLYSASNDGTIAVWDLTVSPAVKQYSLRGHTEEVYSLAVCARSARLFSCSGDGTIAIWDLASDVSPSMTGVTSNVSSVIVTSGAEAISHPENHCDRPAPAVAVSDPLVKPTAGKPVKVGELTGHEDTVYTIILTKPPPVAINTNCLISGSWDQWIFIWDLATEKRIAKLTGHYECVEKLAVSNDNARLFSGAADGTICIWNIHPDLKKPVKIVALADVHGAKVTALVLNSANTMLFSSSSDQATGVIVWDLTSATVIPAIVTTLTAHNDGVRAIALSHDETKLVTGSLDNSVLMWQLTPGSDPKICGNFPESSKGVSSLLWCKNHQGTNIYSKIYIGLLFGQLIELLSC